MFCATCGAPLPEGAGFCMQCGTPAGGLPPQQQMGPGPGGWQGGGGDAGGFGLLANVQQMTIQQEFSMTEAATGMVGCGCCETENKYKVFNKATGQPLVVIEEKAGMMARGCCAPEHSLLVHFYTSDARGNKQEPIMTLERPGRPCDKPCVGVAACGECCLHEMTLHKGFVDGDVGQIPKQEVMGSAKVPNFGGWLTPSLEVFDASGNHLAMVEKQGTCLFGGLSEACCDTPFSVTNQGSGNAIATITKEKPESMTDAMKELASDADTFTLEITDPSVTPEQKGALLGTLVMLDYMFFERDSDGAKYDAVSGECSVNFCNCYFMGCITPCQCKCGGGGGEERENGGGGGDGGGF